MATNIIQMLATNEHLSGEELIVALGVDCIPIVWLRDRIRVFGLERNVDWFGDPDKPCFNQEACYLLAATAAETRGGNDVRLLIQRALERLPME